MVGLLLGVRAALGNRGEDNYAPGGVKMSSVSLLELPESVLLRVFWFLGPVDLYLLTR